MNRPKKWCDLPYPIREAMAANTKLKYDPYESSRAEALDWLLCDPSYYDENNKRVQSRYESFSDNDLIEMAKNILESLNSQTEEITKFIGENKSP